MRRFSFVLLSAILLTFVTPATPKAEAYNTDNHTGFYFYAMGGFMGLNDDTNVRTNLKFDGVIKPAFGLTLGDNVADWIGPEVQFAYSTSTGNTPGGPGREHALSTRLNAKFSLLTRTQARKTGWKFLPYLKAGAVFYGLFVNAPADVDKVGAFGAGFGAGGGLEVDKGLLYLGLDLSNDFLFLQNVTSNVDGVRTKIIKGGFDYQISLMGAVGMHF